MKHRQYSPVCIESWSLLLALTFGGVTCCQDSFVIMRKRDGCDVERCEQDDDDDDRLLYSTAWIMLQRKLIHLDIIPQNRI